MHTKAKYQNQCKGCTCQRNNVSLPYLCDDQNKHRQKYDYCKYLCYHFPCLLANFSLEHTRVDSIRNIGISQFFFWFLCINIPLRFFYKLRRIKSSGRSCLHTDLSEPFYCLYCFIHFENFRYRSFPHNVRTSGSCQCRFLRNTTSCTSRRPVGLPESLSVPRFFLLCR